MPDFTVAQYGSDVYGRPVLMTAFMHDWWEAYVDQLGFRPRILQGCFMARIGGGASASQGAHDEGGCIDIETEGLTTAQIDRMVWVARNDGGGAYRRDPTAQHGGMTQHMHITVGADQPLSDMAQTLWASYLSGGDGLAAGDGRPAGAPDYERRPDPLVLTPPEEMFMPTAEEIANAVWARQIPVLAVPDKTIRAGVMLGQIHNRTGSIKELAAKVSAAEPTIDQAALERALAKVLGSLDD